VKNGVIMKGFKSITVSFALGLLFWLGLNSSFDTDILISGVLVSAIISLFFVRKELFSDLKITPFSFVALIHWLFIFAIELIKSNIDVMFRVVSPKIKINPAIVEVKTKLKSDLGRLALANSITLTPGTLTTDIKDDSLFIHWIDATATDIDGATKKIVTKFEKPLEVIFG
jgi:multicomponent Na+:H+ antiporter subunit E